MGRGSSEDESSYMKINIQKIQALFLNRGGVGHVCLNIFLMEKSTHNVLILEGEERVRKIQPMSEYP